MKILFICPCKNVQKENPVVLDFVKSIQITNPNHDILICDSNSPEKEYLDLLLSNVLIEENNEHFGESALYTAFTKYPNYDYYFILHDSALVNDNIEPFCDSEFLAAYGFFDGGTWSDNIDNGDRKRWAKERLALTDYKYLEGNVNCIYGSMFLIKRALLSELYRKGANLLMPLTKKHSEAMERVWGMILAQEGYNSSEYNICGMLGEHVPNDGIISKRSLKRD